MSNLATPVARRVLDQLQAWGVRRIYGVAGDAVLPLLAELAQHETITFIAARHEEAAAFMAKAEAQTTGGLGVCLATSGPGAAHLVNALADAMTDSAPVLAITGQVPSERVGTLHKQSIDQQRLLDAVTHYTAEVTHPHATIPVLNHAMRTALSRQTTAHVSIPVDFWRAPASPAPVQGYPPYLGATPRSHDEVIAEAGRILAAAQRPAFLAGVGVRGAVGNLMQLAEHVTAPVVYTLAAAGQLPGWHHLVIGAVGEGGAEASGRLLAEADVIVRLGATWWPKEYMPRDVQVIDVNMRPDHIGLGTPNTYGVVGRTEEVLPHFFHEPRRERPAWAERIAQLRSEWFDHLTREASVTSPSEASDRRTAPQGIHPATVVATLTQSLPEEAIIALDVGEHVLWFARHFRGNGRQDILVSGYWRTMGFGLPAAIGARLANPHRPVVAFVGDGGFTMTMAELLTAVQLRLPIVVVVVNNHSLVMEEHEMMRKGMPKEGVRLHNPDFAGLARLCGARGFRVDDAAHLGPMLQQAFAERMPAVVDVLAAPTMLPLPPRAQPKASVPGAPVPTPVPSIL